MGNRRKPALRDGAARNNLVVQWLGLPIHVANRMRAVCRRHGLHPDDAEQEGMIALIRAAELFDDTRGVKFNTYAYRCIARHLQIACARAAIVHVPDHPGRYAEKAARARNITSLDEARGVPARTTEPPEPDDAARLRLAMRKLSGRHQQVLRLLFEAGMTQAEVARRLCLSRERVRQIRAKAIARLRWCMGVAA